MDVTKAPPMTDPANLAVGTAASPASTSPSSAAAGVSTSSNASTAVTAAADRVDIQPLDVAAALQILIAEVRAELPLPGADSAGGMLLGAEPTDVARPVNAPPALRTAEFVAVELVMADLVKADLVAGGMPGAAQTPAPPVADRAPGPLPPTPPAGPLLPGSPEQSVPLAPLVPMTEPPMQEPLPETPDFAAIFLRAALGTPTPGPGYLPQVGNSGADVGAAGPLPLRPDESVASPQLPLLGGELPRAELPVIAPNFDLGPLEPLFMPPGARLSSPAQAAPVLVRLFLQMVPEDAGDPARWSATVTQLEVTLQSALDRAVATVEQWRNVPQVVVEAAKETRGLVMSQLNEEPPLPLWLRPEWMWLRPRMERFRRRRRLARRGFIDPDLWSLPEDDIRREVPGRRSDEP